MGSGPQSNEKRLVLLLFPEGPSAAPPQAWGPTKETNQSQICGVWEKVGMSTFPHFSQFQDHINPRFTGHFSTFPLRGKVERSPSHLPRKGGRWERSPSHLPRKEEGGKVHLPWSQAAACGAWGKGPQNQALGRAALHQAPFSKPPPPKPTSKAKKGQILNYIGV